ncbi:autophagy protein 5-like [Teleopsis dalmanni]|uniref:autophagy protein 5-like n=1 Tax=Teleopsis dalmanni TaxID=139649 RepID=UPI0018CCD366|nr:autophagy protein 5-like [Teleopsis dalmanni]
MSYDREILRSVWDGRVAMCFQADPNEINGLQQPDSFYMIVPRLSYLTIVTDKIKKYFNRFVTHVSEGHIWFDYAGVPLRTHYPIAKPKVKSPLYERRTFILLLCDISIPKLFAFLQIDLKYNKIYFMTNLLF